MVTHFYLSIGIKFLNMHYNEAYAMQEQQEKKGFLRFKLDKATVRLFIFHFSFFIF